MRRRLVAALLGVVFALILAVALMPWWFGAAAQRLGPRFGLTFATYERIGYGRFAFTRVVFRRANVEVRVQRVEADTPVRWGWYFMRREPRVVAATTWSVEVAKPATPARSNSSGWVPLRRQLLRIARVLDRWVPVVQADAGVVRWPGGGISVGPAHWAANELQVRNLRYRSLRADAALRLSPDADEMQLVATSQESGAVTTLESRGPTLGGTITWWNQPARVTARFGDSGWMPPEATLQTDKLRIPGDRFKLAPAYASVTGFGRIEWRTDHFLADIALRGEPAPSKEVPPLDLTLRGHGDAHQFTLEALHIALPGVVAHLTQPVTIERSGRIRESAASLTIQADLAQQRWITATGLWRGQATVVSVGGQVPAVEFEMRADDVAWRRLKLREASVSGRLRWPRLQITAARVQGIAGDEVHGAGEWNFHDREVANAKIEGVIDSATVAPWVPPALRFERAVVDLQAYGDLRRLRHVGRVTVTELAFGNLKPVEATLSWRGTGTRFETFTAEAKTPTARIIANGAADGSDVRLAGFTFYAGKSATLQLTQPASIAWRPRMSVNQLTLTGQGARIDAGLRWGRSGQVKLAVAGFQSSWIREFMPLPGPNWKIESLAVTGEWRDGPMKYTAEGDVVLDIGSGRTATITIAAHGAADGLHLDALHGSEGDHAILNARGILPVTIRPSTRNLVAVDQSGVLRLDATTVPNSAFWRQLATTAGIELLDPRITAHITGTWNHPQGQLAFRAAHAEFAAKRFAQPVPEVDNVDIAVTGDSDGIRLVRLALQVEHQLVSASGRLPLPARNWNDVWRDPIRYLRSGAQLEVEIPSADVAMFSHFLPTAFAPAGRLQARVTYDRGALGGYLRIHGATTRPLGPLGVLQQVEAEVVFSDHRVDLRRVTATAGGEPVTLSGTVQLPVGGLLATGTAQPTYDLALRGNNLPFVRESGLLVRGDLDLTLRSPAHGPPTLAGKVTLRDSLFLSDVRAFLPRGPSASPDRRPPYFSISTPPLNTWVLDVDVTGTRFMRLRMPVFSGVASARFHLGGTLGVPRATGVASVDEGSVLMPFATFTVTQGDVRLTEEDPFEPTIFLRGTGRHYGYDLTMEISGKASTPDIQFTSSPALDSEQVLLMIMTGAAPSNGVNTSLTHRAVQIGEFVGQGFLGSVTGSNSGAERLSIESGEKISLQGKETYQIEYKLNDRWSLTGEYDEFDEYNAGFKWRVAPKKEKP